MPGRSPSRQRNRLWWKAAALAASLSLVGMTQLAGCGRAGSVPRAKPQAGGDSSPLAGNDVVSLDLRDESLRSPTRVTRLSRCDIALEPDGAIACDIVGSADQTGGQYGGIRFRTGPIRELQLDIAVLRGQEINSLQVDLVDSARRCRLDRWVLSKPHEGPMSFVFRPGTESKPFVHTVLSSGTPDAVDVLIKLRPVGVAQPRAHAGFIVNRVRYRR